MVLNDTREEIEQQIIPEISPGTISVVSRARYSEDALEEAVRQGVNQYRILGAGMDTFAFRRQDLTRKFRVLEIDHPITQEFKLQRFAQLEYPKNLHFIPLILSRKI